MARVLVVDDSPDQARLIADLLESAGHSAETAGDGRSALAAISANPPDIVVTDLVMPEFNGLELVEAVVAEYPAIPVILMTAFGSGEIAMEALRKGAASYVPKSQLQEQLAETVDTTFEVSTIKHQRMQLRYSLDESEFRCVLGNDPSAVTPLVGYVQEGIAACSLAGASDTEMMQITLALQEALTNAIHHGNLGVSSEIKDRSWRDYLDAINERRTSPECRDKRVFLSISVKGQVATMTVRDEGKGFDIATVPDPTDPENLLRAHGRGLYLIGTFMDEVRFNETGNEITMVKKLVEGAPGCVKTPSRDGSDAV